MIKLLFLGVLTVTSYRSVPNQTDSTPFITSTNERVHDGGVAVSRDLLCPLSLKLKLRHARKGCQFQNKIHYGDQLFTGPGGFRVVNDCMNARHKRRIDLWVPTLRMEKKYGVSRQSVYLVLRTPDVAPIQTYEVPLSGGTYRNAFRALTHL